MQRNVFACLPFTCRVNAPLKEVTGARLVSSVTYHIVNVAKFK